MKKRNYRTKKVNQIDFNKLKNELASAQIAVAIDIAKQGQFALLVNEDASISQLFRWKHPEETSAVLAALSSLNCPTTIIIESTSTYGDALRYQFRQLGFEVHQASAKRVHDAKEVYDGVPSLHDAKAATIIARLYSEGLTKPWQELTEQERNLNALRREFHIHQSNYQANQGRLEAYLSRHWPEVTNFLKLSSVTLESLLVKYGSPQEVAANAKEAMALMKKVGRSGLAQKKIEMVIQSAKTSLGEPCLEFERAYLQALAKEMAHGRTERRRAQKALEMAVDSDDELYELGKLLGRVTVAILLSFHLDPRKFNCARSYQKSMGLNLKEKSSGRYVGQLKITKRGSSKARQYFYFAVLRLINNNPLVKQWYENKLDFKAKNKTVIAVMRKLAKAAWYVGRGEAFDASKLFSVSKQKAA